MKSVTKLLRILFNLWGIVSFVVAVCLVWHFVRLFYFDHYQPRAAQTDFATATDVQRVLNLGQLDVDLKYQIVHSFRAEASIVGERCETLAIRLEVFPEDLLNPKPGAKALIWNNGPQTNPIIIRAIDSACGTVKRYGPPWFPTEADIKSEKFSVCVSRMTVEPEFMSNVRLLAYDRQNKLLFYVGSDD